MQGPNDLFSSSFITLAIKHEESIFPHIESYVSSTSLQNIYLWGKLSCLYLHLRKIPLWENAMRRKFEGVKTEG